VIPQIGDSVAIYGSGSAYSHYSIPYSLTLLFEMSKGGSWFLLVLYLTYVQVQKGTRFVIIKKGEFVDTIQEGFDNDN
jgi:hypothetical protein